MNIVNFMEFMVNKFRYLHRINFYCPIQFDGTIDKILFVLIKAELNDFYLREFLHMAIAYAFLQVIRQHAFIIEYGPVNLFFVKGWEFDSQMYLFPNVAFMNMNVT